MPAPPQDRCRTVRYLPTYRTVPDSGTVPYGTCWVGKLLDIHGWKAEEVHSGAKYLAPHLRRWRLTPTICLGFRPAACRLVQRLRKLLPYQLESLVRIRSGLKLAAFRIHINFLRIRIKIFFTLRIRIQLYFKNKKQKLGKFFSTKK